MFFMQSFYLVSDVHLFGYFLDVIMVFVWFLWLF